MHKKISYLGGLLTLTAGLFLSSLTDANGSILNSDALKQLNAVVAELLQPYNQSNSVAQVQFLDLKSNDLRAVALSARAKLKLSGLYNTFDLNLKELSYSYPESDNALPKFKLSGKLNLDLIQALGAEQLSALMQGLEQLVQDLGSQYLEKYGSAAEIQVESSNKKYDENNQLIAQLVKVRFILNTKALPEGIDLRDVDVIGLKAEAMVTTQSITARVEAVFNPKYRSFESDQVGLKELVDGLLAQDQRLLENLQKDIGSYLNFVSDIVNRKANNLAQ